jgi:Uncharacterized conserved protein (DUF2075)
MEPRADLRHFARAWFGASVSEFLDSSRDEILGRLVASSGYAVELAQRDAWVCEVEVLQAALANYAHRGHIFLEFVVPRLGKRIDALVLIDQTIFVVEFKVGEKAFVRADSEQVWDYALDLKNFHETSHAKAIAPILVITGVHAKRTPRDPVRHVDGVYEPVHASADQLQWAIAGVLGSSVQERMDASAWEGGRYQPTPTIIEAAAALFSGHTVADIARSDAGSVNLTRTSAAIRRVIEDSRAMRRKAICLVTGVPGAGKTLVGLDVAARYMDADSGLHSVYLSGNGPLVGAMRVEC